VRDPVERACTTVEGTLLMEFDRFRVEAGCGKFEL
jgi:hypothetical protein